MTLTGWQRLWVLVSALYLIVVVAVAMTLFPRRSNLQHDAAIYAEMDQRCSNTCALSHRATSVQTLLTPSTIESRPAAFLRLFVTARKGDEAAEWPPDVLRR